MYSYIYNQHRTSELRTLEQMKLMHIINLEILKFQYLRVKSLIHII